MSHAFTERYFAMKNDNYNEYKEEPVGSEQTQSQAPDGTETESNAAKILRIMGDKAIRTQPETTVSKKEAELKKRFGKYMPEEERKTQAEGVVGEAFNESGKAKVVRVLSASDVGADDVKAEEKGNWFSNFWYHHKWKTIIIAFFAVVIGICMAQMLTKDTPDVNILYVGPQYLDATDGERISDTLKSLMHDYNGDGEIGIRFSDIVYLNEQQIEAKKEYANLQGEPFVYDMAGNMSNYEQFQYEVMVGDSVIYLLDPAIYDEIKGDQLFLELSEIMGETPEGALDEYGIPISELEAYDYFTALRLLPKDTVLCIRRVSAMSYFKGEEKAAAALECHKAMLSDLFGFKAPAE